MELKAGAAAAKERRARTIAVLADTTIMKDVHGNKSNNDPSGVLQLAGQRAFRFRPLLLQIIAREFDKHTEQMPHGIVELVDRISLFLCGCSLYHDEHLHRVEFAALEIKKLNDSMDMDLLVRKSRFVKTTKEVL